MNRVGKLLVVAVLALVATEARATSKNIWLSAAEIAALPMSGTAWDNVSTAAYATWVSPNLADQEKKHAAYCVAGALVSVRLADTTLKGKVRDGILAAKRTLDAPNEYTSGGARTLGVGRQLVGYSIAADLIDLEAFSPGADGEFRPWLDSMRTRTLPATNDLYGETLIRTHECTNGWGLGAGASRLAIELYLGNAAGVARCDSFFKAHSDQSRFPTGTVWFFAAGGDYFIQSGAYEPTWICTDTTRWLTISPACIKTDAQGDAANIDGAVVTQISRAVSGGPPVPFVWPPYNDGQMYQWTAMNGLFLQAEMLQRAGYLSYEWGNQALRRSMDFIVRAGWVMQYATYQFIPWIANKRYGTSYPTATPTLVPGWSMSWTDWTHAPAAPCPPSTAPPAPVASSAAIADDPEPEP